MIQVKQFNGIMNLDDSEELIPQGQHIRANNIVFPGNNQRLRPENVLGTTFIPNLLLPAGANEYIGGIYDQVRGRIIWANHNSNSNHAFYIYTPSTNTVQRLIQCGVNTNGDVLNFNLTQHLVNFNIIYGDSTQGDILYFLNCQKEPCKININRALASGYGVVERGFLEVIKAPPQVPPQVVYEDDTMVTVNNLRKRLFKFKYRYVYDDKDKSVWSAQSEIPLPYQPFSRTVDTDPTKNAVIPIVFQTGDRNVVKIEIAAAVSLGAVFSDFFSVTVLDKSVSNIASNEISTFKFYNNKAYNYVDVEESILEQDSVPQNANAQETLNGNVLFYGGITEGYPNVTNFSNGTNTTNVTNSLIDATRTNTFYTLFAIQGTHTAFGSGNIHIVFRGLVTQNDVYSIFTTNFAITYTALLGDTASSVIAGLQTSATGQGFTIINTGANDLIVVKINEQLIKTQTVPSPGASIAQSSEYVYDWWSGVSFGEVYFDKDGRTNGTVYPADFSAQTLGYSEISGVVQIPQVTINIWHRPPLFATYYHLVRTKNTAKSNIVQWVSDRTFKDSASSTTENTYAYISIESLNTFVKNNPGSPLGYSFSANDRIRFIKRFNGDGSTANLYANKDFEIVASLSNPKINGVDYIGQFIKIVLPVTDATFDFGTTAFFNFFIEIYTPAQSVANGLDVYYEFSERFEIIDPGTDTAYHQGQDQNQSADLSQSAIFFLTKGDYYFRTRTINTGVEIIYQIEGGGGADTDAGQITLGCDPISVSYNNPNILTGSSPYNNLAGFNIASDNSRWIIKIVTGTFIFRIIGTITITFPDDRSDDNYSFQLSTNTSQATVLVPTFDSSKAGTYTFSVDTTFTLTSGERIFIFGLSGPNFDHTRSFTSTNLTVTSQQSFTQGVIDPHFSDYYASSVNSNGRPWVFDADADTTYFSVLTRWGGQYESDTNINRSNRFYPQNFDTVDRERGDILRFKTRDRICRIFQKRGCGQVGVYTKFIQDSGGTNTLTTTDEIITSNNVQYYAGEYGLGDHPESLVSSKIADYFWDNIRGYHCRLSNDGIIPISELYKGQYTLRGYATLFNQTWSRGNGLSKILGCYDYLNEECISIFQDGTNGVEFLAARSFSFNEKRNGYSSFFDYQPDGMICAEDVLYHFKDGALWVQNNGSRCRFYGQQFNAYIDVVFNDRLIEKKTWESITEIANKIWYCPIIYTNAESYPGQRQESNLIETDFTVLESNPTAPFFRDVNSVDGLINGDTLKGNYLVARFQVENASSFVFLTEVLCSFIDSPLTNR